MRESEDIVNEQMGTELEQLKAENANLRAKAERYRERLLTLAKVVELTGGFAGFWDRWAHRRTALALASKIQFELLDEKRRESK
ncbi:MAG TPA: hypothetical protein VI953_02065 [Candidatus Paceibacterota bacterium]